VYATVSHVEAYCPARAPFSSSTKPTASQVAIFIEDATIEVEDHLLKAGYPVPVPSTATYAFRFMQGAVAKGAAYFVEETAPTSNKRDTAHAMYQSALKMIDDGELVGLDKETDQAFPRYGFDVATPAFRADQLF
jgi:hypothetical protein